jgi:hypothetical protein
MAHKAFHIWALTHNDHHVNVGWIDHRAPGRDKPPLKTVEEAADFLMSGEWWPNLYDIANIYRQVYVSSANGKQRSKLRDPLAYLHNTHPHATNTFIKPREYIK